MAVSTIDGTFVSARIRRAGRKLSVLSDVTFRLDNGTSTSLPKVIAAAPVAALLTPGIRGRFYVYHAIDHRGIHGVRTDQGLEAYGHPINNEAIMAIVAGLNLALVIGFVVFANAIPLLMTILSIFGSVGFFLFRSTRMQAKRQFEADAGFHPAGAPLSAVTAT